MTKYNPWPGIVSYEDPVKSKNKLDFCGRDNDIYDMTRLVDDNLVVVLYGKSGIGKTSLLNAGVFPALRKVQYVPVSIRLGTLNESVSYQNAITSTIENAITTAGGAMKVINVVEEKAEQQLQDPDYLWSYFVRHRFFNSDNQPVFPVIVLDQFEEVLRYADKESQAKSDALLTQIHYLSDESHALNDCIIDGEPYYYDFNFRFVVSIREDELYLLEDNIDKLSVGAFKRCRYRLRSLSPEGARAAILIPGKDCIEEGQKDAFAQRVIELSTRSVSEEIDTLLLSLVCAGTYGKKAGEKITLSDLTVWKDNPMEVYYQDAIQGLPDSDIKYIQDHLIYADGTRKSISIKKIKDSLSESSYKRLTEDKDRLLHETDQNQAELIHDQLALAVFDDRKKRQEQEAKARKIKKIIRWIGTCSCILGALVLFGVIISVETTNNKLKISNKKQKENQSRYIAEKAYELIEQNNPSFAIRLLLEVLPNDENDSDTPITIEAESALRNAVLCNNIILKGHTSEVNYAAFSPDGKRIASAGWDKYVRIWDTEKGTELFCLKGHSLNVNSAVFNPDGTRIVSASWDNTIRIWDAETGLELQSMKESNSEVNSVVFSPDGKRLVSASWDDTVRVWDAETGKVLLCLGKHTEDVNYATYSPDGKRIISASDDKTVRIWDAETGRELGVLKHDAPVRSTSFSPNGELIATASDDKTVRIWNVNTKTNQITIHGHSDAIRSIAFSPDGKHVASASIDKTIRIWDVYTGEETEILEGHGSAVNSVAYSMNGKCIVSASDDHTVHIWDNTSSSKAKKTLQGHSSIVYSATFSPDRKHIASSSQDRTICVWDFETGEKLNTLIGHDSTVYSAVFSPDGKLIVSASQDNTVRVWDMEKAKEPKILKGHTAPVYFASFSPDGKLIVSASKDKTVRVWDMEKEKELKILKGHTTPVYYSIFSPDGKYIVSASDSIIAWDTRTGNAIPDPMELVTPEQFYYYFPTVSPDRKHGITTDLNTIFIWDRESGLKIMELSDPSLCVYSSIFSPDGRAIISTSSDGAIRIWDFPPLQELIDQTRERFKDNPLTPEERRMYYLE